ncbi:hypothetical protein MK805_00445 [Shimazuella sp. AN120528]|uniref:hypothetical protein n=1 Tax=Shimazuella soli TaxID=1892854 RepID=UPI001F113B91|nr:hypothetical protein [Shimazuella soli]MCH5583449.1 hypothetical protein [Shimazuella soli]
MSEHVPALLRKRTIKGRVAYFVANPNLIKDLPTEGEVDERKKVIDFIEKKYSNPNLGMEPPSGSTKDKRPVLRGEHPLESIIQHLLTSASRKEVGLIRAALVSEGLMN